MMKYINIVCTGHPRSGTHYIAALVSINFLGDKDYLKIYRNHETPEIVQDPNIAYLNIWRDFEGMARSIFVLKERFGLSVDSYEAFLKTRYSDMWQMKKPDKVVTNVRTLTGRARFTGISDFFKRLEMNPREYWKHYNNLWAESAAKNNNVINVKYDDMLNDFDGTMSYIGTRLGSHVTEFKRIERKVGWWK